MAVNPFALIVDMDDQRRSLVGHVLKLQTYQIVEAESSDCLEVCERLRPELVMLTASLPDDGGDVICKRIRGELHYQPAIFMILEVITKEAIDCTLQSGADDYITSPVNATLL